MSGLWLEDHNEAQPIAHKSWPGGACGSDALIVFALFVRCPAAMAWADEAPCPTTMARATADEAWSFANADVELCEDALILQDWPKPFDLVGNEESVSDIRAILEFKELKVNEALEELRTKKEIGQSLDAEIEIRLSSDSPLWKVFKRRENEMPEIFIVSSVIISEETHLEEIQVSARHAPGVRCPRSWRWVPELVKVDPWGEVSPRCAEVLAKLA